MKNYVNWSIVGVVGVILAVATMIFYYFIFPMLVHYQVVKTLSLENGTEAWDRFVETPIPLVMKLYFFEPTNPDGILKGEKPVLKEVGPFVYREKMKKQDIGMDTVRDVISYRQGIEFIYDRQLSGNRSDSDNITLINPVYHLLAQIMEAIPTLSITEELIEFAIPEISTFTGVTITVPVRELLFDGAYIICNKTELSLPAKLICAAVKNYAPVMNLALDNYGNLKLALLDFKKLGPLVEIVKGDNNPEQMGKIVTVDGMKKFSSWHCDSANVVSGYDMTMFSPFQTKDTVIPLFAYEARTSIKLEFQKEIEFAGIPGYRYGIPDYFMGDINKYPEARCYCPGPMKNMTIPEPCLEGSGAMSLASTLDLPIYLTLPHFYRASNNYHDAVIGLHPNKELHESFMETQPITGVPIRGFRRIQMNIRTKPLPCVKFLKNHSKAMVPLVWLEEGAELGEEQISMLRDQLLKILKIMDIVRWCLFAVGVALFLVGTAMAIFRKRQEVLRNRNKKLFPDG